MQPTPGGIAIVESEVEKIKLLLKDEGVKKIIPRHFHSQCKP